MKKLALIVAGLLLAGGVYAQGDDRQEELSSISRKVANGGATIEWYGERSGIIGPCMGNCVAVCKRITYPDSKVGGGALEVQNASNPDVIVSDGETTIVVKASQVDWRTGAVKTK